MHASISSADLCHRKGLGSSLTTSIFLGGCLLQLDGRAVNPRLNCFSDRSAKNVSTWLSHD